MYRALSLSTGEGVREETCGALPKAFLTFFWSSVALVAGVVCVVVVGMALVAACLRCASNADKSRFWQRRLASSVIMLLLFSYTNVSSLAFRALVRRFFIFFCTVVPVADRHGRGGRGRWASCW